MSENEAPERIWIDDLMIESSRKRGYGRYYFDHHFGNNAPDMGEYIRVRANPAAPDAAQQAAKEIHVLCDELAPDIPGDSTSYAPSAEQIAAIIVKHFATTDALRQARRDIWEAAIDIVKQSLDGDDAIARMQGNAAALRAEGKGERWLKKLIE